jgi:hypothetical protein
MRQAIGERVLMCLLLLWRNYWLFFLSGHTGQLNVRTRMILWQPMFRTEIASAVLASEGQKNFDPAFVTIHPLRLIYTVAVNRLYVSLHNR